MTVHLVNAGVMPQPGTYQMRELTRLEFVQRATDAFELGELKSYVSYPETAKMLEHLLCFPVTVSIEWTRLQPGDQLLIARMKFRCLPGAKRDRTFRRQEAIPPNFDWLLADYSL